MSTSWNVKDTENEWIFKLISYWLWHLMMFDLLLNKLWIVKEIIVDWQTIIWWMDIILFPLCYTLLHFTKNTTLNSFQVEIINKSAIKWNKKALKVLRFIIIKIFLQPSIISFQHKSNLIDCSLGTFPKALVLRNPHLCLY